MIASNTEPACQSFPSEETGQQYYLNGWVGEGRRWRGKERHNPKNWNRKVMYFCRDIKHFLVQFPVISDFWL